MDATSEFKKFGLQFIQDFNLLGDTLEEILHHVLMPFKGEERTRLRAFLDEVLNAGLSDAELHRLWNATPSDVFFYEAEELRNVLRAARDRL